MHVGQLLDERHIAVDDAALAAIDAAGGVAIVETSDGSVLRGELHHDGQRYLVRLDWRAAWRTRSRVTVRPKGQP